MPDRSDEEIVTELTADLLAVFNEEAEDSLFPPLLEQDVRPFAEALVSRGWAPWNQHSHS